MMAIKISKRMFHLASNKYSRGILNAKSDCVRYLRLNVMLNIALESRRGKELLSLSEVNVELSTLSRPPRRIIESNLILSNL